MPTCTNVSNVKAAMATAQSSSLPRGSHSFEDAGSPGANKKKKAQGQKVSLRSVTAMASRTPRRSLLDGRDGEDQAAMDPGAPRRPRTSLQAFGTLFKPSIDHSRSRLACTECKAQKAKTRKVSGLLCSISMGPCRPGGPGATGA